MSSEILQNYSAAILPACAIIPCGSSEISQIFCPPHLFIHAIWLQAGQEVVSDIAEAVLADQTECFTADVMLHSEPSGKVIWKFVLPVLSWRPQGIVLMLLFFNLKGDKRE